jgi:hypothetical protein
MDDMRRRESERIEHLGLPEEQNTGLLDLSTTGACCCHGSPKGKESVVNVRIKGLTLKARVVYCTQRGASYRLGVQFIGVLPEEQRQLSRFVDEYSRGVPLDCDVVDSAQNGDGKAGR